MAPLRPEAGLGQPGALLQLLDWKSHATGILYGIVGILWIYYGILGMLWMNQIIVIVDQLIMEYWEYFMEFYRNELLE